MRLGSVRLYGFSCDHSSAADRIMPSLLQNPSSETCYVRFRYGGRSYKRSLNTADKRDARSAIARIDETIRLLERGRLEMPPNEDPATFILSDGKVKNGAAAHRVVTLGELFQIYEEQLPAGAKEATTLACEKIHRKHLKRILKSRTVFRSLTGADTQAAPQRPVARQAYPFRHDREGAYDQYRGLTAYLRVQRELVTPPTAASPARRRPG